MFNRNRDEGLVAQSLYEDLSESDRARLEKRLADSPELAKEAESLARMVSSIPRDVDGPALDRDLMPALRARMATGTRTSESVSHGRPWAMAAFGMACVAAVVVFAAVLYRPAMMGSEPAVRVAQDETGVGAALAMAEELSVDGDYTGAYETLKAAVAEGEGSVYTPEAYLTMARIAFEDLQRYDLALTDYLYFRDHFATDFRMHPERSEIRTRLEVLTETKDDEFGPLFRIAAATRKGEAGISDLESVMTSHPALYVADLAAEQMAAVLAPEAAQGSEAFVQAMATARERCTHPTALAQLELSIGRYYLNTLAQSEEAIPHLEAAAESGDVAVARLAQSELAGLTGPQ